MAEGDCTAITPWLSYAAMDGASGMAQYRSLASASGMFPMGELGILLERVR